MPRDKHQRPVHLLASNAPSPRTVAPAAQVNPDESRLKTYRTEADRIVRRLMIRTCLWFVLAYMSIGAGFVYMGWTISTRPSYSQYHASTNYDGHGWDSRGFFSAAGQFGIHVGLPVLGSIGVMLACLFLAFRAIRKINVREAELDRSRANNESHHSPAEPAEGRLKTYCKERLLLDATVVFAMAAFILFAVSYRQWDLETFSLTQLIPMLALDFIALVLGLLAYKTRRSAKAEIQDQTR